MYPKNNTVGGGVLDAPAVTGMSDEFVWQIRTMT